MNVRMALGRCLSPFLFHPKKVPAACPPSAVTAQPVPVRPASELHTRRFARAFKAFGALLTSFSSSGSNGLNLCVVSLFMSTSPQLVDH